MVSSLVLLSVFIDISIHFVRLVSHLGNCGHTFFHPSLFSSLIILNNERANERI